MLIILYFTAGALLVKPKRVCGEFLLYSSYPVVKMYLCNWHNLYPQSINLLFHAGWILAENLDIMQLFFILLYIVLEILVKLYLKIILKIMKNSVYGGWFKFRLLIWYSFHTLFCRWKKKSLRCCLLYSHGRKHSLLAVKQWFITCIYQWNRWKHQQE